MGIYGAVRSELAPDDLDLAHAGLAVVRGLGGRAHEEEQAGQDGGQGARVSGSVRAARTVWAPLGGWARDALRGCVCVAAACPPVAPSQCKAFVAAGAWPCACRVGGRHLLTTLALHVARCRHTTTALRATSHPPPAAAGPAMRSLRWGRHLAFSRGARQRSGRRARWQSRWAGSSPVRAAIVGSGTVGGGASGHLMHCASVHVGVGAHCLITRGLHECSPMPAYTWLGFFFVHTKKPSLPQPKPHPSSCWHASANAHANANQHARCCSTAPPAASPAGSAPSSTDAAMHAWPGFALARTCRC